MKKIEKFLFIVPNTRWFGKRHWLWFTPAVAMLVPVLKERGLTVEVLEANIDNLRPEEIKARVAGFGPDMVGISNMSLEYWRQAHYTAQLVKDVSPDILIVMGGVHPTTLPEKVMADTNIDYIILGEGERRLPAFLDILATDSADYSTFDGIGFRENGKTVIRKPITWIEDLDALPLPDYSLFNWQKVMSNTQKSVVGLGTRRLPVGIMLTSRGCRFRCCFCANAIASGRKVRMRSPANVLREIDMLVADYGIRELIFTDDEMYADRERCVAIFDGLISRGYDLIWKNANLASWRMDYDLVKLMKASGCYQITISPESGSDRVLKEIIHKPGKREHSLAVARWCRELDIELEADFVIGFPGETWDEIRETGQFAEELDADAVKFAIATPFPGTELFASAVAQGCLPADFNFYQDETLGFAKGVIETSEFTTLELEIFRSMEWDRINFKTPEKKKRYAGMNMLTQEELDSFRRETRRNLGVYFLDQVESERTELDQ